MKTTEEIKSLESKVKDVSSSLDKLTTQLEKSYEKRIKEINVLLFSEDFKDDLRKELNIIISKLYTLKYE